MAGRSIGIVMGEEWEAEGEGDEEIGPPSERTTCSREEGLFLSAKIAKITKRTRSNRSKAPTEPPIMAG